MKLVSFYPLFLSVAWAQTLKTACGSGDVHYTTYDGQAFDNQGFCEYVFTSNGKICNNVSPPSSQEAPWGGRMASGSASLYEANNYGENFFQVINEHQPIDPDASRAISIMKQTRVMYKPFERTDEHPPGLMQFLCERQPTAPRGRTGLWWPWVRQTNNAGVEYWMPLNGGMASPWGQPWNGDSSQRFKVIHQIKVVLRGYDLFLGVNDDLTDVPYMYHPTSYDIKITCAPEICVSVFENQHDTLCGIAGNANGVNDFNDNNFRDRFHRMDGTAQRFDYWNEIAFLWPNQDKCPDEGTPPDTDDEEPDCLATQEQQDLCLKINDHANCNLSKDTAVNNCIFDVCAFPTRTDEWVCNTMAGYVHECNLQSDTNEHITSWRTVDFCPVPCGTNEHHNSCAKRACQRFDDCDFDEQACADSTECVELCVCDHGFVRNSDGDCVDNICDSGDCYEINSVYDLMELVGGVDNRNTMEHHGCFCANLENTGSHGVISDDADSICKNNLACKKCNPANGDSYTVSKSGSDFICGDCDDQTNSDGGQVRCQCDLQTVKNILDQEYMQQTCVARTGSGGTFQCCGEGFKQMMYNADEFTCSVEYGEPSVENISTGAVRNYI